MKLISFLHQGIPSYGIVHGDDVLDLTPILGAQAPDLKALIALDLGLPLHGVRGIAAQRKNYLMSFQNAAFRRQAMKVNMPRNNSTQTPMRTRVF